MFGVRRPAPGSQVLKLYLPEKLRQMKRWCLRLYRVPGGVVLHGSFVTTLIKIRAARVLARAIECYQG